MKIKLTLTLLAFMPFCAFAQTQINVIKKPSWEVINESLFSTGSGNKIDLPNESTAMLVSISKTNFGVVTLDKNMGQKWLTELQGIPYSIGRFKNQIMVIASLDDLKATSSKNDFTAYLLDEKTGKLISQKIIFEGSHDFIEDPQFFFSKDGSYFKMSSRLTGTKKRFLGLNMSGAADMIKQDKNYSNTKRYVVIDFNDQLEQIQKIEPVMPNGDTWSAYCGEDGSFLIGVLDTKEKIFNVSLYLSSNASPLKTISIPLDLHKDATFASIQYASSKKALINYFAIGYKNVEKDKSILLAKVDFKTGTSILTKEIFDKDHVKELKKSFIPVGKDFKNVDFDDLEYINIRHIEELNDQVLTSVSPRFSRQVGYDVATSEGSVLLNVYDAQLKKKYNQIIPRTYKSKTGEGGDLAFSQHANTLRIIANHRDGGSTVDTWFTEMDLTTGKIGNINLIPKNDIKSNYYANTNSISWLDNSFIIPFLDRSRFLSTRVDQQLLLLNYK